MKTIVFTICAMFCIETVAAQEMGKVTLKEGTILYKIRNGDALKNEDVSEIYLEKYTIPNKTLAFIQYVKNTPIIKISSIPSPKKCLLPYQLANTISVDALPGFRLPYAFEYNSVIGKMTKIDSLSGFMTDVKSCQTSDVYCIGETFKFKELSSKLQALTIPFKRRPKFEESFATISTGVNIGVGYAIKFMTKKYKPYSLSSQSSPIGYVLKTFSYTLSPFIGLNKIELKPENTNPNRIENKDTFGMSLGAVVSLGLNGVDLGLGLGMDYGLAKDAKNWNYQGKPWLGFVVGIGILK